MRVCDVVLNSIWYDPRVRKQINSYVENGVEVICVGYKSDRFDAEKVAKIPCPVHLVERDARYVGRQRSPIKKVLREIVKNRQLRDAIIEVCPDIIHANDLDALIPCMMAAKKLKCPVVYDSHEICVENHQMKGAFKKYFALMEKRLIGKVDRMVCVSHAAADYFVQKYGIEKPLVVTNCSLLSEQVLTKEKNEGFEVLNHGQYYGGRGYDIMVEALPLLKQYPDIKIAMRGFGHLEEQLRARSKELGDENMRFYPPVTVQQLIACASGAHVGVAITEDTCLNFRLSMSNKLFEYASAGLPVIMSDIPEHRYLNEKYKFGVILKKNTPGDFADAVIKLYTDKDFYNACAEGAENLTREVNWEREFAKLIALEQELKKQ